MKFFSDVFRWLTEGTHWEGSPTVDSIPHQVLWHVELSALAVLIGAVVALPVGVAIGHTRRGAFLAVTVANLGRAIPSFGVIALASPVLVALAGPEYSLGFWPTLVALVLLAIPPMLTNAYVGVDGVDRDTVEAARGMGLSGREVLWQLELRLAVPLILAGMRTAAVQVVATATLAALIGGDGLGRYIVDGYAQQDYVMAGAGAVLVALLAIATELGFGLFERVATPRFTSRGGRRAFRPGPASAAVGSRA